MEKISFEKLPFFVYGTLRPGQINWYLYFQDRAIHVFAATIFGHKLYHKNGAYLCEAEPSSKVFGNMVYLQEEGYDELMPELDIMEEYDPIANDGHYVRVIKTACYVDADGEEKCVRAWIYQAGPQAVSRLTEADVVKSGDWLAR